jgi:hypothetical protein
MDDDFCVHIEIIGHNIVIIIKLIEETCRDRIELHYDDLKLFLALSFCHFYHVVFQMCRPFLGEATI